MTPSEFKQKVIDHGIVDPEFVHHGFAYGTHGQKLEFGVVQKGTDLYEDWVFLNAEAIASRSPHLPDAVIGIANGTNLLARDTAARLGIRALFTRKINDREVTLTPRSKKLIVVKNLKRLVALEDVGTTGNTVYTGVTSAQEAGADEVEVQITWKRCQILSAFVGSEVKVHSIIDDPLPTYTPEECAEAGFCADPRWLFIPHKQ